MTRPDMKYFGDDVAEHVDYVQGSREELTQPIRCRGSDG
jgi:hypothetical protein